MVTFDRNELIKFNLEELRKMLEIQIQSEKFEGAALIRDVVEQRKKDFGIGYENNDDTELQ